MLMTFGCLLQSCSVLFILFACVQCFRGILFRTPRKTRWYIARGYPHKIISITSLLKLWQHPLLQYIVISEELNTLSTHPRLCVIQSVCDGPADSVFRVAGP